jgi:tetratricopeptide (TPR) repeat protein
MPSALPTTSSNPFGAPTSSATSANPFGVGAPANPFGVSAGAGAGAPNAAANPFGSGAGSGAGGAGAPLAPLAPLAPANPFGGAVAASSNPFATSASPSLSAAPAANPFGDAAPDVAPSMAAANPFADPPPPNQSFGGPDPGANPFGLGAPPMPEASTTQARPGQGVWQLRTSLGDEPLDLASLRERIKQGSVQATDLVAAEGEDFRAVKDQPMLAVSLPSARPAGAAAGKARAVGARAARGGGIQIPWPTVLAVGGVLLLLSTAFAIWKFRPELLERQTAAGENPLRRVRATWNKQFPDQAGTAQEHIVAGRRHMRSDTAAGVRKADEEFKQALLLDVGNLQAIAGFVENVASSPKVRVDAENTQLAKEAVEYGLRKQPHQPDLLRAQGALAHATGAVDPALAALSEARATNPTDVATVLWLAKAMLDRSPKDALDLVQKQVRSVDKEDLASLVVEGAAQRRLKAFKEARTLLSTRLSADPQNVPALKEMARLEVDLGNADAALAALRTLQEVEDQDYDARLLQAKVLHQLKGDAAAAEAALAPIAGVVEAGTGDLAGLVGAHLVHVKAAQGKIDEAIALGEQVRSKHPNLAAGMFALAEVYAKKGDAEGAKRNFESTIQAMQRKDAYFEPLARSELAWVQASSGDVKNAMANFQQAIAEDIHNQRAAFGLAALLVRSEQVPQALVVMRRAQTTDPNYLRDHRTLVDYPVTRADLAQRADAFRSVKVPASDEATRSILASSEGLIRMVAGDLAAATDLTAKALKDDRFNPGALLLRGVMQMDVGRPAEAKTSLRLAIDGAARQDPITRLYYARALLALNDDAGARAQLNELLETNAEMVEARFSMGELLQRLKLDGQAAEQFRAVLKLDPDHLPAKRALAQ